VLDDILKTSPNLTVPSHHVFVYVCLKLSEGHRSSLRMSTIAQHIELTLCIGQRSHLFLTLGA
jgi:hypothetical protein